MVYMSGRLDSVHAIHVYVQKYDIRHLVLQGGEQVLAGAKRFNFYIFTTFLGVPHQQSVKSLCILRIVFTNVYVHYSVLLNVSIPGYHGWYGECPGVHGGTPILEYHGCIFKLSYKDVTGNVQECTDALLFPSIVNCQHISTQKQNQT